MAKSLTFIFFIVFTNTFAQTQVIQDLNSREFKQKIETTKDAVILDLRTSDETSKGIIPNAVQIDYFRKDFVATIQKLDKDKVYLIYCASGGRSGDTKELMEKAGFKTVYNLSEGFEGWKQNNFPTSKNK